MKNVLAIGAHPDDIELGCGGTLARHVQSGDNVTALFITCGINGAKFELERLKKAEAAAAVIGYKKPYCLANRDQELDAKLIKGIINEIERIARLDQPNIIYTHHIGDLNLDHQITARAVLTACRPLPGSTVEAIYGFEVLSTTELAPVTPFVPQHFVELSQQQCEKKIAALRCYDSEMRQPPHPRSYQGVMDRLMSRGHSVGVDYAEAFTIYRQQTRL